LFANYGDYVNDKLDSLEDSHKKRSAQKDTALPEIVSSSLDESEEDLGKKQLSSEAK
jgi:hypothetical protein